MAAVLLCRGGTHCVPLPAPSWPSAQALTGTHQGHVSALHPCPSQAASSLTMQADCTCASWFRIAPETVPEAQRQATGSVSFSEVEDQNAWQPADGEAWQSDVGSCEGDRASQDKGGPCDDSEDPGVTELLQCSQSFCNALLCQVLQTGLACSGTCDQPGRLVRPQACASVHVLSVCCFGCMVEAMLCPAGRHDTQSRKHASPLWRFAAEMQHLHPWERYRYVSDSQLFSGQHLPFWRQKRALHTVSPGTCE